MIELKDKLIESLLYEAIQQATKRNETQLVSITKKINAKNPIHFFEAAKHTGKNRIFWTSTAEDFYLVGVGSANEIIANESRIHVTKENWETILAHAIIHDPYQVLGTGILALGGMSFDPKKEKSPLWKQYKHSQFRVPEFTLIKDGAQHYFTMTTVVSPEDNPEELATTLQQMEEDLLNKTPSIPISSEVIAKEEIAPDDWKNSVRLAREMIEKNQAKKIVLAREMRLKLNKEAELSVIIDNLLQTQSNSYIFAFEQGEDCFVGATPERLVKVEGDKLLSTCLAGTTPRGKTDAIDKEMRTNLLNDDKNREEHDYVVKMIRSKIEQFCADIHIPDQPIVYPLKNLHHLYTPVTATLKNGYSVFEIIQQLHPTPALGGVPREESLAFIREHELLDRGWYGAPVGWLDSNHNSEFAVAIRSGLIQGDEASLFAGCGVMKDSDIEAEYEETIVKFLPMLTALEAK